MKKMFPHELVEYISGTRVEWAKLFQSNTVPENLIFEYKDKIFKNQYSTDRSHNIINMFKKAKIKISEELGIMLLENTTTWPTIELNNIFDLKSKLLSTKAEEKYVSYVCEIINEDPNNNIDLLNHYIEFIKQHELARIFYKNDSYSYDENTKALFRKLFLDEFTTDSSKLPEFQYVKSFITENEYAEHNNVYSLLTNCLYNVLNKSEEILEVLYQKIINLDSYNIGYFKNNSSKVMPIFSGHVRENELKQLLVSEADLIKEAEHIEWSVYGTKIRTDEISDSVILALLSRDDVPFSFLERITPKLLHLSLKKRYEIR